MTAAMPRLTARQPSPAVNIWVVSLDDSAYALGAARRTAGGFTFRPERLGLRRFPKLVRADAPDLPRLLHAVNAQLMADWRPPLVRHAG